MSTWSPADDLLFSDQPIIPSSVGRAFQYAPMSEKALKSTKRGAIDQADVSTNRSTPQRRKRPGPRQANVYYHPQPGPSVIIELDSDTSADEGLSDVDIETRDSAQQLCNQYRPTPSSQASSFLSNIEDACSSSSSDSNDDSSVELVSRTSLASKDKQPQPLPSPAGRRILGPLVQQSTKQGTLRDFFADPVDQSKKVASRQPVASTSRRPPKALSSTPHIYESTPSERTAQKGFTSKRARQNPTKSPAERRAEKRAKNAQKQQREARLEAKLSKLPIFSWNNQGGRCSFNAPTRRIFTADDSELQMALTGLSPGPVGFDMEWNFSWRYGQKRTGIIQICDDATVIVFSVSRARDYKLPRCLVNFLSNSHIHKLGVNISGDARKLHRDWPDLPPIRGLIELSDLARCVDASTWAHKGKLIALRELAAQYVNVNLQKGSERTSNWEAQGKWAPNAKQMSERQLDYASGDVVIAKLILDRISENAAMVGVPMPGLHELAFVVSGQSGGDEENEDDGAA